MKIELVKQLISEFENSEVHKMKIEIEDLKLELEKPTNVITNVQPVTPQVMPIKETNSTPVPEMDEEPKSMNNGIAIKSPLVGVFYRSSAPTAKAYVEVGDQVKEGQVLCIVEAMKVMNEIKAPMDGTITAIAVENDDLVEFDQILMMIEG